MESTLEWLPQQVSNQRKTSPARTMGVDNIINTNMILTPSPAKLGLKGRRDGHQQMSVFQRLVIITFLVVFLVPCSSLSDSSITTTSSTPKLMASSTTSFPSDLFVLHGHECKFYCFLIFFFFCKYLSCNYFQSKLTI